MVKPRGFFKNNTYFAFYFKAIKTEPLCCEMFRRLALQGAEPDCHMQTVHFPQCAVLNWQLKTRNQVTWKNNNIKNQVTQASKQRADFHRSSTTFCEPDFLFVCMWRASAQWEDTFWSVFTQFFTDTKKTVAFDSRSYLVSILVWLWMEHLTLKSFSIIQPISCHISPLPLNS